MQYTNVKIPATTAWLDTDQDIFDALNAIVGKGCTPCGEPLNYEASIGYSNFGPWVEGDIAYMRDGLCYTLAYDFMVFDDTARVFRVGIDRHPDFDEQ